MAQQFKNYYQILGIPAAADIAQIRKVFHELAFKYHPDRNHNADAEEKFKEINEAYQVLSDPSVRSRYDEFYKTHISAPGTSQSPPKTTSTQRDQVKKPFNVYAIEETPNHLRIVRHWLALPEFAIDNLVLFLMSGIGFLLIILFFLAAISITPIVWSYVPFVGKIVILMIWGFFVYPILAICINRTTIDVSVNTISVQYGPLPCWPFYTNKVFDVKNFKTLLCKQDSGKIQTISQYAYLRGYTVGTFYVYSVYGITQNDNAVQLVKNLANANETLYIKRQIESFLQLD